MQTAPGASVEPVSRDASAEAESAGAGAGADSADAAAGASGGISLDGEDRLPSDPRAEHAVRGHEGRTEEGTGGGRPFAQPPPFALPSSLQPQGYEKGTYVETWRAASDEPCRDLARELLLRLRESGMELVKADYLDLFGEAWGCVLKEQGEASLSITLVPEGLLRGRDGSNPLRMTLTRTVPPPQPSSGHQGEPAAEKEDDHGR
jgi:hypothetical protein